LNKVIVCWHALFIRKKKQKKKIWTQQEKKTWTQYRDLKTSCIWASTSHTKSTRLLLALFEVIKTSVMKKPHRVAIRRGGHALFPIQCVAMCVVLCCNVSGGSFSLPLAVCVQVCCNFSVGSCALPSSRGPSLLLKCRTFKMWESSDFSCKIEIFQILENWAVLLQYFYVYVYIYIHIIYICIVCTHT